MRHGPRVSLLERLMPTGLRVGENLNDSSLTISKVALGSVYLAIQNVLSMLIGVLGYAFLARVITQEEMGMVAGLTLLTALVQLISDFGLNSTIAKFVSELKGRKTDVSVHVFSALFFKILLGLLLTLILIALSPNLSSILLGNPSHQPVIVLIILDSLLLSVSSFLNNILLGLGKIKNIAVYGVSSTMVRWLFIIVLLLNGNGLIGLAIGWIMGDSIALLLYSITVTKNVGSKLQATQKYIAILSDLLKFSWPIYVSSIIYFLYTWYDRVLILTFLTLSDLGVYNVAYQAFSVPTLIATSLSSSLLPYYGMAYGAGDDEAIILGVKRVSKYAMLVISPLMLGLATTAKPVITLFAGQQYELGWPVLTVLSVFGLVYSVSPALGNLLLIYGKTKIILLLNVLSIALSLILIPLLSILKLEGLAVMKGVSFLSSLLLSLYFISKTVKIQMEGKVLLKILASSVAMAIVVILIQELFYNKFFLMLYVFTGGIVYLTIIRSLKVLDEEDFKIIREIMGDKALKLLGKILGIKP